jgi:hypothetical protein
LRGVTWQGRVLSGRDTLPSAEAHYLRHVAVQQEWPAGLTLTEYIESIRDVIRDPASGAALSLLSGEWHLTVVRRSGALRGPQGHEWLMVDYRVSMRSWMTAYQMRHGLSEIMRSAHRQGIRWLRHPR